MPNFYIFSENTEDTFTTAETLGDAIRLAGLAVLQMPVGELVTVLERGGSAVKQYVHLPNSTVGEQVVVTRTANPAAPSLHHQGFLR